MFEAVLQPEFSKSGTVWSSRCLTVQAGNSFCGVHCHMRAAHLAQVSAVDKRPGVLQVKLESSFELEGKKWATR